MASRTAPRPAVNPIPTFRTLPWLPNYRIGDDGTIQSRFVKGSNFHRLSDEWRTIKPYQGHDGTRHPEVKLRTSNGKRLSFLAHRLVLEAFVGPCPDGMECCHGDGDPANNRLDNLRWDTPQGNADDRGRHGRTAMGAKQGLSKLTESDVLQMRRLKAEGFSAREIAVTFGITKTNVYYIINRHTWKHV